MFNQLTNSLDFLRFGAAPVGVYLMLLTHAYWTSLYSSSAERRRRAERHFNRLTTPRRRRADPGGDTREISAPDPPGVDPDPPDPPPRE